MADIEACREPLKAAESGQAMGQVSDAGRWKARIHTPTRLLLLRTPNGIRTRVTALKGRRPRPLDDGGSNPIRAFGD